MNTSDYIVFILKLNIWSIDKDNTLIFPIHRSKFKDYRKLADYIEGKFDNINHLIEDKNELNNTKGLFITNLETVYDMIKDGSFSNSFFNEANDVLQREGASFLDDDINEGHFKDIEEDMTIAINELNN